MNNGGCFVNVMKIIITLIFIGWLLKACITGHPI